MQIRHDLGMYMFFFLKRTPANDPTTTKYFNIKKTFFSCADEVMFELSKVGKKRGYVYFDSSADKCLSKRTAKCAALLCCC